MPLAQRPNMPPERHAREIHQLFTVAESSYRQRIGWLSPIASNARWHAQPSLRRQWLPLL